MENINIDALPYFDKEYEQPEMRKLVDELVSAEMKNNTISENHKIPQPISFFKKNALLRKEYDRVSKGLAMDSFDTERYKLEPPKEDKQRDPAEWEKAVNNAQAQLEHQTNRIENLELLGTYGVNSWKVYNAFLERISEQLKTELEELKDQITHTNKSRKYDQTEANIVLTNLENRWKEKVYKTAEIKAAILELEQKNI
ncbi:hypothetical protein BB561_004107 [Smittium simulii]|uniref:Pre-mRNA-splicing factor SPF27 n=1 Tax=Smittium simulii TaxID=133385 RepID=A0A2T9YHZ4_9FUNG|nr:hypothetical protein BB561_004107 [Smittium simulii]